MLTSFDDKGAICPFRFRLQAEDERLVVIKIDKVLFNEENKSDGTIKYRCECIIQDKKQIV